MEEPHQKKKRVEKLKSFYFRYERHISSIGLVGGFVFTAITLKRVDMVLENVFVLIHLIAAMIGVFLLNYVENKRKSEDPTGAIHFWLVFFTQAMFGDLLSVYLVFYFRSASLGSSWPFLLLLAVVFVANELLKKHYSRLMFQIGMLFISTYSFAIYILPVVLHRLGPDVFVVSGVVSVFIIGLYIAVVRYFTPERLQRDIGPLMTVVGGTLVIINIFYFTNLIPPLPLSLKEAGVYHNIVRDDAGNYLLQGEAGDTTFYGRVRDFFTPYPLYHRLSGEPVYVFSSIFSPTALNPNIIHNWQHYNEKADEWVSINRIPLSIVGGSDKGYRTFSFKTEVEPGKWRVDVETPNGQDIGRLKFRVVQE